MAGFIVLPAPTWATARFQVCGMASAMKLPAPPWAITYAERILNSGNTVYKVNGVELVFLLQNYSTRFEYFKKMSEDNFSIYCSIILGDI
jgi:TorA maturation chaperone TorD